MARATPKQDKARERRIAMEIVVDAYDAPERAMGWYYYLESYLKFPFMATCIARREISPLHVNDEVAVLRMAGEDECEHEMFVATEWEGDALAVPLSQLRPIGEVDELTKQGVADWHYWVKMGHKF